MVYLVLTFLLLSWYTYWKLSRRHMEKLAAQIPGLVGLPFIGEALQLFGSASDIFKTVYDQSFLYGKVIKAWLGPKLYIALLDPVDIEVILSSHVHIDKSPEYNFFKPWLGNGLLISTGSIWKSHRKLIAPTFHLNVLKSFIDLLNVNSRETVKRLGEVVGKEIDCHGYMSVATVEMLLETVMGVSKKTVKESSYDYTMAVLNLCNIIHLRQLKLWLRPDILFNISKYRSYQSKLLNIIHGLTQKVVQRRKLDYAKGLTGSSEEVPPELHTSTHSNNFNVKLVNEQAGVLRDDLDDDVGEKKRIPFLDMLIEASYEGDIIKDEEIIEQVNTIMFEGHDTVAAAGSFFLCLVGLYQKVQDRIVEELHEIFGDSSRPATFNDTLQMKYLERCIMETLRLYPPVPIIARQINTDVKLASGNYIIPAGTTVIIGTLKLHRDADLYPNPEIFDPDNFLPERIAKRHYYSFIPFSAGPRSCVGRKYAMLKLKILLSTILRNYKITSDVKEQNYQLQADIILKRSDGFKITLENRKSSAV